MAELKKPFSLSIKSTNPRLTTLYPNSVKVINALDAFNPVDSMDNISSNPMDESVRGNIDAMYPDEANRLDNISFVNGKSIRPLGQTDVLPQSARNASAGDPGIPSEITEEYDQTFLPDKFENTREPVKSTSTTVATIEAAKAGFPDLPRPDLTMRKNE